MLFLLYFSNLQSSAHFYRALCFERYFLGRCCRDSNQGYSYADRILEL